MRNPALSRVFLQTILAGAFALSLSSRASAIDAVSFTVPGVTDVAKDDLVDVTVGFSFSDLTVGGGFDLSFSSDLFAYKSFTFDGSLGDDPAFRMQPADDASTGPFTIAFGSFSLLTGDKTVGILELVAKHPLTLGSGYDLLSGVSNVNPAGPFVDQNGATLPVQYLSLIGIVPEPGAPALLGVGLVALGLFRRACGGAA